MKPQAETAPESTPRKDVTTLLSQLQSNPNDQATYGELIHAVYDELRSLASSRMRHERPGHTLQPTALVHEVFIRLNGKLNAASRTRFFGAASQAMRRVLLDHARKRKAEKRGGGRKPVLVDLTSIAERPSVDIGKVGELLEQLEAHDSEMSELVQLRWFGGHSVEEAAGILGISKSTAENLWRLARNLLREWTNEE